MPKKKTENFEALCRRLEEIVQSLEDEQLPFEESIKLFTEEVSIASKARARLEEGEKTVKKLIQTIDRKFTLEELEG